MDRFEDLRTFTALVQEGGFAAAADRLGIVKSAVSRRIRDLEERLDVRLVHRTSRQISLTEAGRVYQERAEEILEAVRGLDDLVRTEASELSGPVRISMPSSFAANCFDEAMLQFSKAHPLITLEVHARDDQPDIVREGIDVALMLAPLQDSTLVARRLLCVRHAVCASPGYLEKHGRPETPSDLARHACIGFVGATDEVAWRFADGTHTKVPVMLRASSCEFMRAAAKIGVGVARLPTFVIADALADGSLEVLLPDHEADPSTLHIVFPASRHVPARVRALIDHLAIHYEGAPTWDRRIEVAVGIRGPRPSTRSEVPTPPPT